MNYEKILEQSEMILAKEDIYIQMANEARQQAQKFMEEREKSIREYVLGFCKDHHICSKKYAEMRNHVFQMYSLEIRSIFKKMKEVTDEINDIRIKSFFERYRRYWSVIQKNLRQDNHGVSRYDLKDIERLKKILAEVQRLSSEISKIKVSEKNKDKLKQRINKLFKKFFNKLELILGIPTDKLEGSELHSSGYSHQVATEKFRVQLN